MGKQVSKAGKQSFRDIFQFSSVSTVDETWKKAIEDLIFIPVDGSNFSQAVLNLRRLILTEAIRLRWYPEHKFCDTFGDLELPLQECIGLTGKVAYYLMNLVDEVFSKEPCGYKHPAQWFRQIVLEEEALGICAHKKEKRSKNLYLQEFRTANQFLFTLQQPWSSKQPWNIENFPFYKPNTRALFLLALTMAEMNKHFYPHFMAYAKARRPLATFFKKQGDLLLRSPTGGMIIARQGMGERS